MQHRPLRMRALLQRRSRRRFASTLPQQFESDQEAYICILIVRAAGMNTSTSQCLAKAGPSRSWKSSPCVLPQRSCSAHHPSKSRKASFSGCNTLQHRASRLRAMPAQATEEEEEAIPYGYLWYETMIILRPDLDEENRDRELAKFEAFLQTEGAVGIDVLVRPGSQQLAYPIKGYWDGIYVLYFYAASPKTAQGVQKLLSMPAVGTELNILRHMTFRQ